ncbi:MAG TPA: DUF2934 domain-containing protein [Candidatus Dormibacteraeota bacterium]|jgi:hypothetical protein
MNTAIEERIRSRAYELWEAEGRPEGREVDHWLRAAQEVSGEVNGEASAGGAPVARRPRTRTASGSTSTATRTPAATATRSRASKGTAPVS